MEQRLPRYMAYSLGAHAALFIFLFLQSLIFASHPIIFQPTIQVDLVALPDQSKTPDQVIDTSLPVSDKPPPPKEEAKIEEPAPVPVTIPAVKPREKSPEAVKKDASKALQKLKEEMEKQRAAARAEQLEKEKSRLKNLEERSRQALRGNQVNQGTSVAGVNEQTLNAYAGHVTERLRAHWALPTWLQSGNLSASVRIYINQQGRVERFVMNQSSGNEAFDNYVRATVEQSSPFAPPPAEMARQLAVSGIQVGFPL